MKNQTIAKQVLFWVLAALYCFVLPFFVMELILGKYLTYSSLNLSLVFLGFLVHVDVLAYLIYRYLKNSGDKK